MAQDWMEKRVGSAAKATGLCAPATVGELKKLLEGAVSDHLMKPAELTTAAQILLKTTVSWKDDGGSK